MPIAEAAIGLAIIVGLIAIVSSVLALFWPATTLFTVGVIMIGGGTVAAIPFYATPWMFTLPMFIGFLLCSAAGVLRSVRGMGNSP